MLRGPGEMLVNTSRSCTPNGNNQVGCAGWRPLLCCGMVVPDEADDLSANKGGNTGLYSRPLMGGSFLFAYHYAVKYLG